MIHDQARCTGAAHHVLRQAKHCNTFFFPSLAGHHGLKLHVAAAMCDRLSYSLDHAMLSL